MVPGNCEISWQTKSKASSCMSCRYKKAAEIFPDPWTMPDILKAAGVKVRTCLALNTGLKAVLQFKVLGHVKGYAVCTKELKLGT